MYFESGYIARREFWRLLSEFLSQGITIFMATPYLDEAERCSRVALMSEGLILALDHPSAIRATFPGEILEVIAEPQEKTLAVVRQDAGVRDVQTFGERLHARMEKGQADAAIARIGAALRQAGVEVTSLRVVPTSLEDVFIDRVTHT